MLPFNDKASPQVILREFGMSKNAFKRAVGHLLKEGKIEITDSSIRLLPKRKKMRRADRNLLKKCTSKRGLNRTKPRNFPVFLATGVLYKEK